MSRYINIMTPKVLSETSDLLQCLLQWNY